MGPAKELLAFAEQHNAKFLTFEGSFSNAELAAKFGKATGDSFAITAEATRQGLLGALKQVGQ